MQKTNQSPADQTFVNSIKGEKSTYGSTKGHSKPGTGGTLAGPPPAPQPKR